jgi:hypothetical protein
VYMLCAKKLSLNSNKIALLIARDPLYRLPHRHRARYALYPYLSCRGQYARGETLHIAIMVNARLGRASGYGGIGGSVCSTGGVHSQAWSTSDISQQGSSKGGRGEVVDEEVVAWSGRLGRASEYGGGWRIESSAIARRPVPPRATSFCVTPGIIFGRSRVSYSTLVRIRYWRRMAARSRELCDGRH